MNARLSKFSTEEDFAEYAQELEAVADQLFAFIAKDQLRVIRDQDGFTDSMTFAKQLGDVLGGVKALSHNMQAAIDFKAESRRELREMVDRRNKQQREIIW